MSIAQESLAPEEGERAKAIVFHEFTHAISGTRMIKQEGHLARRQRNGLRRALHDDETKQEHNPTGWVDEAVTERLARTLARHDAPYWQRRKVKFNKMTVEEFFHLPHAAALDETAYAVEQKMVRDILRDVPDKKKPLQTLLGAYFEDYEPGRGAGKRQPLRNKLYRMMHNVTDMPALNSVYDYAEPDKFTEALVDFNKQNRGRFTDRNLHTARQKQTHRAHRQDRRRTKAAISDWHNKSAA